MSPWLRCVLLATLCWVAPPAPLAAQPAALSKTAPEHYERGPRQKESDLRHLPRQVRPIPRHRTSQPLMTVDRPLPSFYYDRRLSQACRAGRFLQVRDRMYVVRLAGEVHGAVQGARLGLFDPDQLAAVDVVYAVRNQGTGRCQIYRIGVPTTG